MELRDWSVDTLNDAKMKTRIRGVAAHMKKFDFYYGLSLGDVYYAMPTTSVQHSKQKTYQQLREKCRNENCSSYFADED